MFYEVRTKTARIDYDSQTGMHYWLLVLSPKYCIHWRRDGASSVTHTLSPHRRATTIFQPTLSLSLTHITREWAVSERQVEFMANVL